MRYVLATCQCFITVISTIYYCIVHTDLCSVLFSEFHVARYTGVLLRYLSSYNSQMFVYIHV